MTMIRALKDSAGVKAALFTGVNRNFDWTLTLKDNAGLLVDITGWSIRASIKQNVSDADANALMPTVNAVVTDGANGVFTVPLSSATISGEADDALLIIWRDVSGDKKILSQYYVDVIASALD